jgi:hypothetical protein
MSASSLPASSVTPVAAPTSSVAASKDTFKPTKRDKAAGESVYPFAENFYRVSKEKSDQQINDALMSLCSVDNKLGKFLRAYSASGPTADLNGTPEEWMNLPLLCNLRSQFLKPTSHILTMRDTLVSEEIDADIFRRTPAVWVQAIWERLRSMHVEDVGHSNEQFVWVMQHIWGKLHPRFNAQKIEDDFRSQWCLDPTSVPERVGVIIAMNIQQIEMSGASGDPSRDLLPIIQRYNSGKTSSAPATATMASTHVQKSNFSSNSNSNNKSNYIYNTKGCGAPAPRARGSAFQPQSRQV